MTKKVVLLSGWAGSGKDTCGAILTEKKGYKRFAFADTLKQTIASPLTGIPLQDFYDRDKKEAKIEIMRVDRGGANEALFLALFPLLETHWARVDGEYYWTPRALAVLAGIIGRGVDTNYWVKKTVGAIKKDDCERVVITDVRFENEINEIKKAFSNCEVVVVRVNRFKENKYSDPSERSLDNYPHFDLVIQNDKSVFDLEKTLCDFLKE